MWVINNEYVSTFTGYCTPNSDSKVVTALAGVPPTSRFRVRLELHDGEMWAVPVFGKSNLIYTLVRSEGVIEVPLNSNGIPAGAIVGVVLD